MLYFWVWTNFNQPSIGFHCGLLFRIFLYSEFGSLTSSTIILTDTCSMKLLQILSKCKNCERFLRMKLLHTIRLIIIWDIIFTPSVNHISEMVVRMSKKWFFFFLFSPRLIPVMLQWLYSLLHSVQFINFCSSFNQ